MITNLIRSVIVMWNYLKGKNFYNWLGVVFVIVGCLVLAFITADTPSKVPSNQSIDTSNIAGRILPRDQVKPGTFAIERPFESKWDETSIMAYDYTKFRDSGIITGIFMEVWQPDTNSSGVFLHSQREIEFKGKPSFYDVNLVKGKNTLMVMYIPQIGADHCQIAMIVSLVLMALGGFFYIMPRNWA